MDTKKKTVYKPNKAALQAHNSIEPFFSTKTSFIACDWL
jgi:hypothetical protein